MKLCQRPGCDNPATPSKGRCWDPYCEGWLAAQDSWQQEFDKLHDRYQDLGSLYFDLEERHRKLREAMDLIAMRQCPRGDFRCPETGDCITEWCEGCIGRRALAEDKEADGE